MIKWKRLLTWFAWILGGSLTLGVTAYLALLAVNWRDQPPSEAAMRLAAMYRNRPASSPEDNGYVYVMGFAVARNEDPRAAGIRRLQWLRETPDAAKYPLSGDPAPDDKSYSSERSPEARSISAQCRTASPECAAALENSEQAIRDWLQSEDWLLKRYMALLQHAGWLEAGPFDVRAPLSPYSMVLDGQTLLLAKASILAGQRDADGVRSLLASDMRFWRRVLESSDILFTKMIAAAALKHNLGVGNLLLRRLPPELAMEGLPQEWAVQLTDAERSLMRCLVGEWIQVDRVTRQMNTPGSWLRPDSYEAGVVSGLFDRMMIPLLRPQDMSNRQAEMFIKLVDTLSVPLDQFPQAMERARAASPGADFVLPTIYNPIGDVILSIGSPAYNSYAPRVADLEGVRRAVVLAIELRSHEIPADRVSAALETTAITTPYTGDPFGWDAEAGAIVFTGLEPGERGRHLVIY